MESPWKAYQARKLERGGAMHPFWVIVRKEVADFFSSWRYIVLVGILLLTCVGSLYGAFSQIRDAADSADASNFLFLKLYTLSGQDSGIPAFITFISFLGPLIGIALGFDAVNSERNKGTLSRIMAQPIHRDYVINAKFVAALIVVTILFFGLGFMIMGLGLFSIGIPPSPEEFLRMVFFLILSVLYVAFWLNLSIFFSVRFRQPATSALFGISIWLFFSIFYDMIINLVAKGVLSAVTSSEQLSSAGGFILFLERLSPSYLFGEATSTFLNPNTRVLSPFVTQDRLVGAIASPLPLGQSLLLVWPQLTGLIAATMICFALSYVSFMRQEIRSR